MQTIGEHFDFLFTTDCSYGRPKIAGSTLRVSVKNLGLIEGHPARTSPGTNLVYISRGHFIFEQVSSSVRTLSPYIGDPKLGKFGESQVERDGPFAERVSAKEYAFEGVLEVPPAWMDWVVIAESFTLEID